MIRRCWRSLVVRWAKWRSDVNRHAAGRVTRGTVRFHVAEQRHEARQLGVPEPQEPARAGSKALWREVDLG